MFRMPVHGKNVESWQPSFEMSSTQSFVASHCDGCGDKRTALGVAVCR